MLYYDSYYLVQVKELEISGLGYSKKFLVSSVKRPSFGMVTMFHAFKAAMEPAEVKQSVWTGCQSAIVSLSRV
jgi:hypothetical protein